MKIPNPTLIPQADFLMNDNFPPESSPANAAPGIPHSREAEEAVVGAVLINPEVYYDVAQFLQADDFYIHRLRWVWESFTRLQESRVPLDLLTVSEELSRLDHLAEIGGPAYLTSLVNQVPTSLHAEAYGRVIEAHSLRRKLLNAANSVATLAYDAAALAAVLGKQQSGYAIETLTLATGFDGKDGLFRFLANGRAERGLTVLEVRPKEFKVIDPAPESFPDTGT